MGKEIILNHITAEYFSCHICKVTVRKPVECSSCEQIFCYECLKLYFTEHSKCPVGCSESRFEKAGHAFEKLMSFIYAPCKNEECSHTESIKTLWVHEKSCKFNKKKLEIDTDCDSIKQRDAYWMGILQKVMTPSNQSYCVQNYVDNSHVTCTARSQAFNFN